MKRRAKNIRFFARSKRYLVFFLPSWIGILIFFIVPFGVVIWYSLLDNPVNKVFVGLQNFITTISNEAFQIAVKNTILFSLQAVPLAVILSLGLAVLLDCKIAFRSQLRTCLLSPMMVPVASVMLVWRILFDYHGIWNEWFQTSVDWLKSNSGQFVILLLFLWKNLGYNMILFLASLSSIPKDAVEVAVLEGASSLRLFFKIKLRYLSPALFFVTLMSFVNSFKVFREVYIMTGDYPYESLYLLQHFINNTFRTLDYQKMSAAAVLISIAMIIIIGVLFLAENWFGKDVEG
ncbi:MAG TPA: sugar ABC transporter permease [Candidatus Fimimorpha faecalis]|uniref:Sugar ABC transporter permease n=1 Tax=Candidatus Fimimorpha faecalis TaxID=2840824 RepID=A0A9D1EFB7_9FIRM|nr:sugar ABC transporter permease [Candidatus Fimimorpha faecalis]